MSRILFASAFILFIQTAGVVAETGATAHVGGGGSYFNARERNFDLYGTATDGGKLGIGIGANYFFTPWLGAGLETRVEKVDWPNQISASLFARYPIEKWRLAPYAYGGCGRQFHDTSQWLAHIGIGADYRLKPRLGLFTDVRETYPDTSKDFTLWRLGLRFLF